MEEIRDVSENGEYKIAEAFFNLVPPEYHFLVDVGALDINYSNTWNLLSAGWSGLLIEPNPQYAKNLRKQFENLKVALPSGGNFIY